MSKDLMEFVQADRPHYSVDAGKGVIRDVLLVRKGTSKNGRLYSEAVLSKAKALYEGAPVYGDHGPIRGDRSVKDKIGWISGVYSDRDGSLRAERLNLLTSHPFVPPILEAAQRNPKLFGLSHNIRAETRNNGSVNEVTMIESVTSVDVVSEPSATDGFHESRREPGGRTRAVHAPPVKLSGIYAARLRAVDAAIDQGRYTRSLRESIHHAVSESALEQLLQKAGVIVVPRHVVDGRSLAEWLRN
jgi:hypothetical protein